jgi:non-ribosomal peptide synthetase component F
VSHAEHEAFFRELLGDIDEPTAPFGLLDVEGSDDTILHARVLLDANLAAGVRAQARRYGVSAASVMHLAWALVLGRITGRTDVVFGTVLFGRMLRGPGADRAVGMMVNTLPIRIGLSERSAAETLQHTHRLLTELIRHEQAPLALALRCSGVPTSLPLFSSLLNYRHSRIRADEGSDTAASVSPDVSVLWTAERSNFPVAVLVDDLGTDFILSTQTSAAVDPERLCEFMRTGIANLLQALESSDDQ